MSQEPGQSGATASAGEQAQTEEVNNATRSTPRKRRASSSSDASDDEVGRLFTNRHGAEKFWLHTSCEDVPNLIKAIKAGGGDIVTMRKDAHFSLFPNKWELPDAHEAARKKNTLPVLANWIKEVTASYEHWKAKLEPKPKFIRQYFCNDIKPLPAQRAPRVEYTDEEKQEIIERIAAYKRLKTPAQLKELWLELSEKEGATHSAKSYFDHYKHRMEIYNADAAEWRAARRLEETQAAVEEVEEEEEEEVPAASIRSIKKQSQSQAKQIKKAAAVEAEDEEGAEEEAEEEEVDELDSDEELPDIVPGAGRRGKVVGGMRARGYSSPVESPVRSRKTM